MAREMPAARREPNRQPTNVPADGIEARDVGRVLVDAITGTRYLDLFSVFASAPLGMNPPCVVDDPAFLRELAASTANKSSNPDVYTIPYARFVTTFARVLGGALAAGHPGQVTNARRRGLMCAVDLPDTARRDEVFRWMRERHRAIALPCGERSLRFRPPLTITEHEIDLGLEALTLSVDQLGD
jgi:4-aminobutyrate aminotransferase-like enzyme